MATPITHILFADKFCDKHPEIEKFPFFAGNCLPDIRYIDKDIPRTKFHAKNISINNVLEEKSDFWKGVRFHSFVDEKRDYFYEENEIYTPHTSDPIFIYSLKFLEDDILYSQPSFRQDFVEFFRGYEFPTKNINEESIKKWKKIICNYFSIHPCPDSRKDFILGVGLSEDLYNQIENMQAKLHGEYTPKINDMISFIESII